MSGGRTFQAKEPVQFPIAAKSVALLPRASKRLCPRGNRPAGRCKVSEWDAKASSVDSLFLEGRT